MVCIITHWCLLSLVQYGKCPASPHSVWKPVMSGTVTARDIWLLTDVPRFLSLQEPPWCGLPVSKDVQMCSHRYVLYILSYFIELCEPDEVPGEAGAGTQRGSEQSECLCVSLSYSRTRPHHTRGLLKCIRILGRTRCGMGCLVSPWWRDKTCHSMARGTFMFVFALVIRSIKARLVIF